MPDKKTTLQVAKTLGITRSKINHVLYLYPTLRPVERVDKVKRYLWSEAEIDALKMHLAAPPLEAYSARQLLGYYTPHLQRFKIGLALLYGGFR